MGQVGSGWREKWGQGNWTTKSRKQATGLLPADPKGHGLI